MTNREKALAALAALPDRRLASILDGLDDDEVNRVVCVAALSGIECPYVGMDCVDCIADWLGESDKPDAPAPEPKSKKTKKKTDGAPPRGDGWVALAELASLAGVTADVMHKRVSHHGIEKQVIHKRTYLRPTDCQRSLLLQPLLWKKKHKKEEQRSTVASLDAAGAVTSCVSVPDAGAVNAQKSRLKPMTGTPQETMSDKARQEYNKTMLLPYTGSWEDRKDDMVEPISKKQREDIILKMMSRDYGFLEPPIPKSPPKKPPTCLIDDADAFREKLEALRRHEANGDLVCINGVVGTPKVDRGGLVVDVVTAEGRTRTFAICNVPKNEVC